jgi:hypothetical protein
MCVYVFFYGLGVLFMDCAGGVFSEWEHVSLLAGVRIFAGIFEIA